MTAKDEVQEYLDSQPENMGIQDLAYEMEIMTKVISSCEDVKAGRVIPHEEVLENMKRWSK